MLLKIRDIDYNYRSNRYTAQDHNVPQVYRGNIMGLVLFFGEKRAMYLDNRRSFPIDLAKPKSGAAKE